MFMAIWPDRASIIMFKRSRNHKRKNHARTAKCQLIELENKLSFSKVH